MNRYNPNSLVPLYWFRVPASVMRKLRSRGFHDGYQHELPLGADARIIKALDADLHLTHRTAALGEWISCVDREAALLGYATFWHPNLNEGDIRFIRKHFAERLVEIKATTIEEALHLFNLTKWNLGIFYHVACMGNWREVVEEQLSLLQRVGLNGVHVGLLGTKEDRHLFEAIAAKHKIDVRIGYHHVSLQMYEVPTIRLVQDWARQNSGYLLYFHTKGVSDPNSKLKRQWRRLMNLFVIEQWRNNVELLRNDYDVVGVNWRDKHWKLNRMERTAHFTGNFWMATCKHLQNLEDFSEYYLNSRYRSGRENRIRMGAEFWIGSKVSRVYSHVSRNERIVLPQFWKKHSGLLKP